MEANKNVIVEKPIAISVEQAKELSDIAKNQNVLFSVYQNRRLDGDFLTVKKLIEHGRLGEILDYEVHYDRFVRSNSTKVWKASGGKGVNVLYDLGVHIIDQAYTLFGMPKEVYADFRKQRQDDTIIEEKIPTIDGNYGKYYENIYLALTLGEETRCYLAEKHQSQARIK